MRYRLFMYHIVLYLLIFFNHVYSQKFYESVLKWDQKVDVDRHSGVWLHYVIMQWNSAYLSVADACDIMDKSESPDRFSIDFNTLITPE